MTGSDGFQFPPGVDKSKDLEIFVNDLSRVGTLSFLEMDKKTYKDLPLLNYILSEELMLNQTANADNAKYQVMVTGTTNMTTSLKAPAFVSKGHFYQISDVVSGSIPNITSSDGSLIEPSESDETILAIEPTTGVNVIAAENLQNNFQIFNDELFTITGNDEFGQFIPFVLVNRNSKMTDEQIDGIFGALILGNKIKWVFFGVLLAFGLLCLGLFALYCFRRKSTKREMMLMESDALYNTADYEQSYQKVNKSGNASADLTF